MAGGGIPTSGGGRIPVPGGSLGDPAARPQPLYPQQNPPLLSYQPQQPNLPGDTVNNPVAPAPELSYEDALTRQSQRDVKSPAEQARIDAALAAGPQQGTFQSRPLNPVDSYLTGNQRPLPYNPADPHASYLGARPSPGITSRPSRPTPIPGVHTSIQSTRPTGGGK